MDWIVRFIIVAVVGREVRRFRKFGFNNGGELGAWIYYLGAGMCRQGHPPNKADGNLSVKFAVKYSR
jgi:hypothetical protein